jgi:hypothetical protein
VTELLDRRTVTSKLYDLGGGQFRRVISRVPMHFERGGQLLDIDLAPEDDGNDRAVRNCPYSLKIAKNEPAYAYNALDGKRVSVELVTDAAGCLYEDGLYKWAEVGTDTDYVIQALPYGVSTLLILQSPQSPRVWTWNIQGDLDMIRPLVGRDSAGRLLELIETRTPGQGNNATIQIEWTGRTITRSALRAAGRSVTSEDVTYPVVIDPVVNENIAANADDVFSLWGADGANFLDFQTANTLIYVGRYNTERFYGGLRFQTVGVPAGATINSATLTMRITGLSGTPNLNFAGNDVDDAPAWATPGNRVKNIVQTTAVVNDATWSSGSDNTATVTSVVAEIIARAGWASGNDMAFGIFDAAASGVNFMNFAALDHATLTEARLAIDYTAGGGGGGSVRGPGRGLTQSVLLKPRALIN